MNDHPAVRTHPVDHAIVDELARVVQHGRVDRPARHDLLDVAGGGAVDDVAGRGPGDMDLLEARHVHQPGLGADREVFLLGIALAVGPRRAHPAPVFQIGPQRAVAVGKCGEPPGCRHRILPSLRFLLDRAPPSAASAAGLPLPYSSGTLVDQRRIFAAQGPKN